MTAGPDLDEISRRLVELAESAGPWDDPLPEVHRRAAGLTTDSESTESPVFRSPAAVRRSLRWVNPSLVASAAAVVALVAGVGWLIHSGGPTGSKTSAASDSKVQASSAAAAVGGAPEPRSLPKPIPGSAESTATCAWPVPTSAVTLRAPAQVRSGASVNLDVRRTGSAAADVYSPLVVVMSQGRVVGRLVVTVIPPGPSVRRSSPTAARTTLTGTLRRSTCAQAIASRRGPAAAGPALAPGRYQLIAVATATAPTASGITVVSAPVTVTVIR